MEFNKLARFIAQSKLSANPILKLAAEGMKDEVLNSQEDDKAPATEVQKSQVDNPDNQSNEEEDQLFQSIMPELQIPDKYDLSPLGQIKPIDGLLNHSVKSGSWMTLLKKKYASAYINDVPIVDLPKNVQEDISKFIKADKDTRVVQYGAVVSELLPKVDRHNFDLALEHVGTDIAKKGDKISKDEFYKKSKDKYILILNDKVIDGHHYIARANKLGITNSLKVLDLTPIRFQAGEKYASVWGQIVDNYAKRNYRRSYPA